MAEKKKRRASKEGNIRHRKDGLYEARVVVGVDPKTGKTKRVSIYDRSQTELLKKKNEVMAALDKGDYTEPSKMTTGQWMDFWQENYLDDVKPSTKQLYEQQIRLYIKPMLGKVKLKENCGEIPV